jgi:hypothetical protein
MNVNALTTSSGRGNRDGLINPLTVVARYQMINSSKIVAIPTMLRR